MKTQTSSFALAITSLDYSWTIGAAKKFNFSAIWAKFLEEFPASLTFPSFLLTSPRFSGRKFDRFSKVSVVIWSNVGHSSNRNGEMVSQNLKIRFCTFSFKIWKIEQFPKLRIDTDVQRDRHTAKMEKRQYLLIMGSCTELTGTKRLMQRMLNACATKTVTQRPTFSEQPWGSKNTKMARMLERTDLVHAREIFWLWTMN